MNATKPQPTVDLRKQYIDNAVKALVLIDLSSGMWEGVAKLKKGAAKAARDVNANPQVARLWVNLLGKHHRKLQEVRSAFIAVRTYLYANSLPYAIDTGGQRRGSRLVPVVKVPEVYGKLVELQDEAQKQLEIFLKEYDRLRTIALSEDMGKWGSELTMERKYPEVALVRDKFYCTISPPRPIPNDAEGIKKMGLPIGMAAGFAEAHYAAQQQQLEDARHDVVNKLTDEMKRVATQLTSGQRFHDTLIENSQRLAGLLKTMTEGYDNDPRLIALADEIHAKIGNVTDTAVWKHNEKAREESLAAAEAVRKSLKAFSQGKTMPKLAAEAAPATAKPTTTKAPRKATKSKGKVRLGGVMGKTKSKTSKKSTKTVNP